MTESGQDGGARDKAEQNWSRALAGYGLIALSVWLGWEVIKLPVVERSGPSVALRLSPSSPEALRRGAEAELAAKDLEDAAALAEASLVKAPFNARALRVRGLAMAEAGQTGPAAEILTLAGNWSLRDDPAHAWLLQHYLMQGDYGLAFGHADTLVRRREDIQPAVFKLFTDAVLAEPRALPALQRMLNLAPPWRTPYLGYLVQREDAYAVLLAIALGLNRGSKPLSGYETGQIYRSWVGEARWQALSMLRRSSRSGAVQLLDNGDFTQSVDDQLAPLAWKFGTGAGLAVEIVPSDDTENPALYVQYDGFGRAMPAEQLLLLDAGDYRLSGRFNFEAGADDEPNLTWTIRCQDTGQLLAEARPAPSPQTSAGQRNRFEASLTVPNQNCRAQWLRLEAQPRDRRTNTVVWFDDLAIQSLSR